MSFLQINSRQIRCTESMLQYNIFYLLPDIQPNTWLLYSKPAFLRLERKLRTLSAFADVPAQQRLNRLLVGHAIELLRDGNSTTLPDEANFINPSSKICWKR